jgi:hypothetical protein
VRIGESDKMAELAWFDTTALPMPVHSQLREHLALLPRRYGGLASTRFGSRAAARLLHTRLLRLSRTQATALVKRARRPGGPLCEARRSALRGPVEQEGVIAG